MKEAMKAKEAGKLKLDTIRMVRAAQKDAEIEKKRDLTDGELMDIISREIKKRKDVIPDYEKANRPASVQQLQEEIKVLQAYLPEQLGETEIKEIVEKVIQDTGAVNSRDMGKVMKVLMAELKGRADGKLVNQLVRERLQ
jgi:hypothetical protein